MPTKAIALICATIFGIGTVLALYGISEKQNDRTNHFVRMFPSHIGLFKKRLDFKINSYYIAGEGDSLIYIGNWTKCNYLIGVNLSLSNISHLFLDVPMKDSVNYDKINSFVDYPNIWQTDPVGKYLISGNLVNDSLSVKKINYSFGAAVFLPSSTMIYQYYDPRKNQILLARSSNSVTKDRSVSLGKENEGFFASDGTLLLTEGKDKLIYLYRYKNSIAIFDTSLNLEKTITTLDTNTIAKVKSTYVKSLNRITMSAPPVTVNAKGAISGRLLYIKSPLIADNEVKRDFIQSEDIDVYDIVEGKYKFSFYLPREEEKGIKQFIVKNGYLLAFYEHTLLSFRLNIDQ